MSGQHPPGPPIELAEPAAVADHFPGGRGLDAGFLANLEQACSIVDTGAAALAEAGRDWWPLALRWALHGEVPARPAAVARPASTAEVQAVARLCNAGRVPLTPAGGRSGVCGGAVPVFGGVALDLCRLHGVVAVDEASLLVDVRAGTLGPALETELRGGYGITVGHLPQSIDISTVGGWIACRGAGQYSTRYGKIEDIVAGLEVVLADGRCVRTGAMAGAGPRSAMGPDLSQLFVGCEGTLGIITAARLRARPVAAAERRSAWAFGSFRAGLDALRLCLRRGATPAVVRLYDEQESARHFGTEDRNVLVALDEGDEAVVAAAMGVLAFECEAAGGARIGDEIVATWLSRRNDVSALGSLTRAGIVVDTVEVSAPWSALGDLYDESTERLGALPGCLAASAHESHAYPDGACLYFSFAGRAPDPDDAGYPERFYRAAWDAVVDVTLARGGSISHHHGIGLVRGPYLRRALGEGYALLAALKAALDPVGILNPGKLGLASPFGEAPWPPST